MFPLIFQVFEVNQDVLPDWMDFDETINEILGVPSDDHIGNRHTIQITASNMSQPALNHEFTLKVVEDNVRTEKQDKSYDSQQKTKEEAVKCPPGSSVTSASVTVDANIKELAPKQMVNMIRNLASHLGMPEDWPRLIPVGDGPLSDASALVSGVGDVKDTESPGVFLQWVVGCGNVQGHHMPILQQLESTSGDGKMSHALGHGVIGWQVTNSRPETSSRMKRMAREGSRGRSHRRSRKKNSRRKHKHNRQELVEGSGFFSTEEDTPPTTTEKPHAHKTMHPPKQTDTTALVPTRVVVTTPTILPESSTTSAAALPEVTTTTTISTTTPTLPKIVTTPTIMGEVISSTPTTVSTTQLPSIPEEEEEQAFTVENPIKEISLFVGDILEYRVPENTFKDEVDGSTRNLKLKLLASDKHSLSRDSWIRFDDKNQTIYGMPLEYHVGESAYILMAVNSDNKVITDTFSVKVAKNSTPRKLSHEFTVTFGLDYEKFIADTKLRLEVLDKIAKYYGDPDMSKITVIDVKAGSVKLSWTNNSIPTDSCPTAEIFNLRRHIIANDNTVKQSFQDAMHPFTVEGAGAIPKGPCDKSKSAVTVPTTLEGSAVEVRKSDDTDKFISTVLPVILILAMIILACIIICCLYRKKRKGKLSDEDNSTFVTKGIPVIFAEELEDKPDPPTKPLIMSKEKPPLPPPEYPKSGSGGSPPSTPGSGHSEPLLDQEDRYTRPPPVTGGTGSMGRRLPKTPTQQLGYRQPPPYAHVPP